MALRDNLGYKLLALGRYFSTSVIVNKSTSQFGMNKQQKKHLKQRLSWAHESTVKKKHIYKEICNFENKWDLAQYLKSTEVFHNDGLIALNKPYGVSRYNQADADNSKQRTVTIIETLNSSGVVQNPFSVEEVLPILKSLYNEKDLEVLVCSERWTSGVLLLGTNSKSINMARKSFKRSIAKQTPHKSFWAVTRGIATPEAAGEKVALSLVYSAAASDHIPVIKKTFSKNAVRSGEAKPNVVEHKVLAYQKDNDAALVEINVIHTSWHFLRLWMAHCYSPILGDLIYSGRVRTVMGKKVFLDINQVNAYHPPDLPPKLLEKIELNAALAEMIPCHCHLAKLKLDTFYKKTTDLVITASPPEFFMWTCQKLGLMDTGSDNLGNEGRDEHDEYPNNVDQVM